MIFSIRYISKNPGNFGFCQETTGNDKKIGDSQPNWEGW